MMYMISVWFWTLPLAFHGLFLAGHVLGGVLWTIAQ